jgi:3-carboxy-cis,cis-muconate cycloisomerase
MTLQNSRLFRHFSGSDEMRQVFSDTARAAHFLRIEVALAKVEADFGIIPASAHEEIARRAAGLRVNWERLRRESAAGPHSVLALVHQLAEACGSSAEYLHWGSAS